MVGIMAESSSYVVREFNEKCFDRTQFILRTVKAPNTFLRSFSETSPTHDVIKVMLMSQVSHISNPSSYLESYYIIDYISQISRGNIQKQIRQRISSRNY